MKSINIVIFISSTLKAWLLVLLLCVSLQSGDKTVVSKTNVITIARNEEGIKGELIRLIVLFGGRNIPASLLINGFEEQIDNKRQVLLDVVYQLENEHIVLITKTKDEIFLDVELSRSELEKFFKDNELLKKTSDRGLLILLTAFNKDWEHLIGYAHNNPEIISMADHFIRSLEVIGEEPLEILKVKVHLLEYYMYATREHTKAIELMKKIEGSEKFQYIKPKLKALFISNKGNLVSTHFSKNKHLMKEVMQELEESFPIFNQKGKYGEALRILACWAQVNIISGNLEKATEILHKGETLLSKVDRPRYKAIYYYIRSWYHTESGEYEKSIGDAEKAIYHLKASVPTPLLFFSYNLKADALYNLKNYKEGFNVARDSLKEAQCYNLSRAADWKAEALVAMAKCSLAEGHIGQAEKCINEADREYEAFFNASDKHIDQGALQTIKGKILMELGNLTQAKECFDRSLSIYSKVLSKDAWYDEQSILYEHLATLCKRMGKEEGIIKYLNLHQKQFGKNHPRTIAIRDMLAQ